VEVGGGLEPNRACVEGDENFPFYAFSLDIISVFSRFIGACAVATLATPLVRFLNGGWNQIR